MNDRWAGGGEAVPDESGRSPVSCRRNWCWCGLMVASSSFRLLTLIGRPTWILPIFAISDSGSAFANMNIGHVKPGPFSLRSFHAHSPSAPTRHAVGAHQLA